jgi:hypothetical protein
VLANFLKFNGVVLSVIDDVPVDSEATMICSSISMICRLRFSEVLIWIGLRACISRGEYVCIFVNVCVCNVFKK